MILQAIERACELAQAGRAAASSGSNAANDDAAVAAVDEKATAADDAGSIGARRADALADVAETFLNQPDVCGTSADRYQVIVHCRLSR